MRMCFSASPEPMKSKPLSGDRASKSNAAKSDEDVPQIRLAPLAAGYSESMGKRIVPRSAPQDTSAGSICAASTAVVFRQTPLPDVPSHIHDTKYAVAFPLVLGNGSRTVMIEITTAGIKF